MIQEQEKSGDYGAAIRGDEQTAAWARETNLGGTDAGRSTSDGANRIAITVGAVLVIALIMICFRLAFDGVKTAVDAKGFTGARYTDADPDAPPAITPGVPAGIRTAPASATIVNLPPPVPVAVPVVATHNLFLTDAERDRLADLLADCRAAYDASGELSQKWTTTVAGANTAERVGILSAKAAEEGTSTSVPRPLTAREWDAIDTQMDAISATVGVGNPTVPISAGVAGDKHRNGAGNAGLFADNANGVGANRFRETRRTSNAGGHAPSEGGTTARYAGERGPYRNASAGQRDTLSKKIGVFLLKPQAAVSGSRRCHRRKRRRGRTVPPPFPP